MNFNKQPLRYLIVEPCERNKDRVVIRNAREATEPIFEIELDYDEVKRLLVALTTAKEHLEGSSVTAVSIQARFGNWLGQTPEKKA